MKLFNTLDHKIEQFKPINPGEVKLYTCGPTVYHNYHIGNLRNAVFNDTLRRVLEANRLTVKHVMNITDVGHLSDDEDEDKLETGARREGRGVWDVAEHYTDVFKKDMDLLNIQPPNGYKGKIDTYARATDFIDEQIDMVKLLLERGYAYPTKQAIYFDTSKLEDYGRLTGQKLDEKETAARAEVISDDNKRRPQDFAVWFFAVGRFANHTMRWPSPWGSGFPGWHIECSAIVHTTLGEPIDIHTGAVDLIGTHHTNEIAQTEAAFGHKLANYWLHNEYLLIEGSKMAKSAQNFYTLQDVIERGYDPLALRLLYLQAHYRSQMNFSWDALAAAQVFLLRLQAWADLQFQTNLGHSKLAGTNYSKALSDVKAALDNDLDTPVALAAIAGLVAESEQAGVDSVKLRTLLDDLDALLGLKLAERHDITTEQKALIADRETARDSGDWQMADKLRSQLEKDGLEINDTAHGPVWSRAKSKD